MNEDLVRAVAAMIEATDGAEDPMVFIPIDRHGTVCGPAEVHYAPPAGPTLN